MPGEFRRALAEGIGTFFLVLIGPGAVMVNAQTDGVVGHAGIALAFAFVVLAMIYAIGHISGAHINPAVTVGFWSVGRFPGREVLPYVLAQCAGAVLASLTLRGVLGPVGALGATVPAIPPGSAFAVEWLLSFVLMFVIMAVATDTRAVGAAAAVAIDGTVDESPVGLVWCVHLVPVKNAGNSGAGCVPASGQRLAIATASRANQSASSGSWPVRAKRSTNTWICWCNWVRRRQESYVCWS